MNKNIDGLEDLINELTESEKGKVEYKFYNTALKIQYIEEKSKEVIIHNNYLECQFNKTNKLESELDKDLSNFTVYEIIEYYKMLNISSLDTLFVMNSQFSMYTQWCLQKNIVKDNQNHFLEMTMEHLKECLNKALVDMKFVSRETVLSWVDQLPNPKDQFVLLGLFEGLKGKDFCELSKLRPEDINRNIASLCTGREIKLSNRLLKIIADCKVEDKYYSITGNSTKVMPLLDKGFVIKDYPNARTDVSDFQLGRKVYNSITRILNYFDVLDFMTANSVFESGKLQMIKERAKELNMSCKDYIYSSYISEVEKKYNSKIVRSIYWLKYEDYLV